MTHTTQTGRTNRGATGRWGRNAGLHARRAVVGLALPLALSLGAAAASPIEAMAEGDVPLQSCPQLQVGSKGSCVRSLQQALLDRGIILDKDGDFGPATRAAVVRAQGLPGSGLVVDGIAGPRTLAYLAGPPATTAPGPTELGDTVLMTIVVPDGVQDCEGEALQGWSVIKSVFSKHGLNVFGTRRPASAGERAVAQVACPIDQWVEANVAPALEGCVDGVLSASIKSMVLKRVAAPVPSTVYSCVVGAAAGSGLEIMGVNASVFPR